MLADVNGVRLGYSDTASGVSAAVHGGVQSPVVVLVHGFPFNRSLWDPQLAYLRTKARVIAPDLRGFGASEAGPPGPLTMEQHADDVAGLLDYLKVREPVLFCGLSMGGYVGLAFWRRHRERVRAFVLADTRAGADTEEGKANRLRLAEATEQANSPEPVIEAMLPKLVAPGIAISQDGGRVVQETTAVRQVRAMMAGTSPRAIADGLRGLAQRPDSTELLAEIDVPTLVLVGEQDQITTPADAEALARGIPNARLEVVPLAGHVSNLENPDEFTQALLRFMEEVGGSGR